MKKNNTTPLDGLKNRPETPNEYARNDVMQYISKFTDKELIDIARASKFISFLPNNPTREQLIEVCTQAILEMYNAEQIKKIIGKNISATKATIRLVDQASAKNDSAGMKISTSSILQPNNVSKSNTADAIRNANEEAKNGNGNAALDLQLKLANGKDSEFTLDKKIVDALPGLKKKVIELLKLYPMTEQVKIATILDLKFSEGDSRQVLSTKIANYVNFYVSLILGKTKGVYNIPITQAGINEVNKILEMTPFAYLAGKGVITPLGIKALKKQAEDAKNLTNALTKNIAARNKQEMFKSKNDLSNSNKKYKKTKFAGFGKRRRRATANYFQAVSRLINSASASGRLESNLDTLQTKIDNSDSDLTGIIFDRDKLIGIAESLNISDLITLSGMDTYRIADAVAMTMASEAQDIQDDILKASKIKNKAERQRAMDAIAEREKSSVASQLSAEINEYKQDFSDKIPIVTFNGNGEIMSEAILQAVPVYIVGQSTTGGQFVDKDGKILSARETRDLLDKKNKANKRAYTQSSMEGTAGEITRDIISRKAGTGFFGRIGNFFKHRNDENYITRNEYGEIVSYGTDADTIMMNNAKLLGLDENGNPVTNSSAVTQVPMIQRASQPIIGIGSGIVTDDQLQNQQKLAGISGNVTWKKPRRKRSPKDSDITDNNIKLSSLKKEINENTRKLFKDKSLSEVQVVYEASNYHEGIYNRLDATNNLLSSLVGVTSQIPILFTGLQSFGLSMNTEGVAAALATVADIANTASKVSWLSTGGTVKAGNKKDDTSTILTGDPQTSGRAKNKANPEIVSVDWKTRQIKVKPTQQYATSGTITGKNKPVKHFATGGSMSAGGGNGGNVTDVKRYTNAERNAPMLVNMSSGLVKYTKSLDGVEDDGTKTAIKVYCVNSGINDKIKVGDTEISLMDAVAGLYATAVSIDSKMTMNTQLLTSIATTNNTIAGNTSVIATNTANSGSDGFSFTNALDSILAGD